MLAKAANSPKGFIYQHLIDNFTLQYYLRKPIEPIYKYHDLENASNKYLRQERKARTTGVA